MLAITKTSAYKICIIKNGDSCIDGCSSNNLILDIYGNKCQSTGDSGKIKLMPEEIYINKEDCDLNIYILNSEETECGLCNYFYPNGNKYKLINNTGCISTIPINADYYNEKHNLLKCKTNYHPDNNECIPDFNLKNEYSSQAIINILCPEGTFLSSDNTCLNCPNLS